MKTIARRVTPSGGLLAIVDAARSQADSGVPLVSILMPAMLEAINGSPVLSQAVWVGVCFWLGVLSWSNETTLMRSLGCIP